MNITLNLEKPAVGIPTFDFPKHSFKAFWTEDGRIGVVAVVERQDGGYHIMQDTIAPLQRTWVGLTDKEIEECWDGDLSPYKMQCIREIESKLREKNK